MKNSKDFRKFMAKARKITRPNNKSILNNICFKNGWAIATNLRESVNLVLHTHELDGYMVNHRELSKALKANSVIAVRNNRIVVDTLLLKTDFIENYPVTPCYTNTGEAVSQSDIDAYNVCKHFASRDATRYYLNGVYFGADIVSTDGRQLHLMPTDSDFKGSIVMVSKLLDKVTVTKAELTKYELFVIDTDFTYSVSLIEGQFPNYKRVFPDIYYYKHFLVSNNIVPALKTLLVKNIQSGEYSVTFSHNRVSASDLEIVIDFNTDTAFKINPQYVVNFFKHCDTDCAWFVKDVHSVMQLVSDSGVHLLMPMVL